jgi:hypothetical protein
MFSLVLGSNETGGRACGFSSREAAWGRVKPDGCDGWLDYQLMNIYI